MKGEKWDASCLTVGERSMLRRCAGEMMGNDLLAVEVFYKAVGHRKIYHEKVCFAALCMECLWREEDGTRVLPIEEIFRSIYQSKDTTESMKKRLVSYIDIPWSDDGFLLNKICRIVRILRSSDGGTRPDFERLADDLAHWNDPDKWVQKRWLRTICRTFSFDETKVEEE